MHNSGVYSVFSQITVSATNCHTAASPGARFCKLPLESAALLLIPLQPAGFTDPLMGPQAFCWVGVVWLVGPRTASRSAVTSAAQLQRLHGSHQLPVAPPRPAIDM